MNCFFDTSALAKLFQKEEGSDFVEELINTPENDIWILDLTRIELLSSVYRRYRQKDISEKELEIILNAFDEQLLEFNQEFLGPAPCLLNRPFQPQNGHSKHQKTLFFDHISNNLSNLARSDSKYCIDFLL